LSFVSTLPLCHFFVPIAVYDCIVCLSFHEQTVLFLVPDNVLPIRLPCQCLGLFSSPSGSISARSPPIINKSSAFSVFRGHFPSPHPTRRHQPRNLITAITLLPSNVISGIRTLPPPTLSFDSILTISSPFFLLLCCSDAAQGLDDLGPVRRVPPFPRVLPCQPYVRSRTRTFLRHPPSRVRYFL